MSNCSSSYLEVKSLGDKVVVGLGYEFLESFTPGFMIFKLSNGKEIVSKSEHFYPHSISLMSDKRYILGVKIDKKKYDDLYLTAIDTWTGKDKILDSNVSCRWSSSVHYQGIFTSYMTRIKDKSYFNVLDTSTGKKCGSWRQ